MRQTVVGVFDRQDAARRAAALLQDSGFPPDAVQVTEELRSEPPAQRAAEDDTRHGSAGMMDTVRSFFAEVFGSDGEAPPAASRYAQALHGGGALVKVAVDDLEPGRLDAARETLQSAGALEIEEHAPATRPYEAYAADFRTDFAARYAGLGGNYEDFDPAYRYGHALAGDPRHANRPWEAIEPEARLDWETRHPHGSWQRFKDAVRHGWSRARG